MAQRIRSTWLPRFLFWLTVSLATLLLGLVLLCPWVDPGQPATGMGARLRGLFAHDPLVRRTTVASALGLYVTATVFFRPLEKSRAATSRSSKPPPPPVPVVGA
jgi:hypothetical protein